MEGWIKLHRQSINSAVFCNANLWQVWCYCLMRANHESNHKFLWNGEERILQPGQFITGRFKGAKDCKMSPSTFRDQLAKLQKLKNLDTTSDNKNSLITIVKWASYQGSEVKPDTSSDINPTSTRHIQEQENGRKDKADSYFFDLLPNELNTVEFKEVWTAWIKYRAEKKNKITPTTAKLQLEKLMKFKAEGMNPEEIINQTITEGWTGLFPLKQDKKQQPEQITSKLKFIDTNQPGWM